MSTSEPQPASQEAVVVHLSGDRRGEIQELRGDSVGLAPLPESEADPVASSVSTGATFLATLVGQGREWELQAGRGAVWINGEKVQRRVLRSGDLIELGKGGPVLRFRTYASGWGGHKSISEVFGDCVDCVRYAKGFRDRAAVLVAGIPAELATRTTLAFRAGILALLALILAGMAILAVRSLRLEHRFEAQNLEITGIAELLASGEQERVRTGDLLALRDRLDSRLTAAVERIETLETRAVAAARVTSEASGAIVFLQGAYGFSHPESGAPLRFAIGSTGNPLSDPRGGPAVTFEGEGPIVERLYTGTGFVVEETGLVLTNRHVAVPWDFDETSQTIVRQGLSPVMHRLFGYLPGLPEPFDVELVQASETADLAILRCSGVTGLEGLELSTTPPRVGDPVIVMGYPTGMRAMLARTDRELLEELTQEKGLDFWSAAELLAELGQIEPLATQGIIGQVSSTTVVYDAETAGGGSGGPVLTLDGKVVAINTAILTQFGGSNLGVPASEALQLLAKIR